MERFVPPNEIPESRIRDYLYYLTENDSKLLSLFLKEINIDQISAFLKFILESSKKTKETREFRWNISCLVAKFLETYQFANEIENEYVEDFFGSTKDQVVLFLLPYLKGTKQIKNPSEIHNIAFYLIVFSETYPGIFDCLYQTYFEKLINIITIPKLFEILNSDFLFILKKPPIEFMRTASFDLSDAPLYFKSPLNFQYIEFSEMLQNRLSLQIQFPDEFPNILNGDSFTLLNTSLTSQSHFFDIISHLMLEHITTGEFHQLNNDTKLINKIPIFTANLGERSSTSGFSSIIPYILVAYHYILFVHDYDSAENLIKFFANEQSLASNLLVRFKNDYDLASAISFLTSNETSVADLNSTISLPKQLEFVLGQKEILSYSSNQFYTISDRDRDLDFDFIKSYDILRTFLYNFPNSKSRTFFSEISDLLRDIKNKTTKESLCLDLFSLLFLRANGKFIVSIPYAKSLLSVLCLYTDNVFIAEGLLKVSSRATAKQTSSIVSSFTSNIANRGQDPTLEFNQLFIRNPSEIFDAISKKKYGLANDLSKHGLMRKFFILAYSINLIQLKHHIPIEALEYNDLINFELTLSLGKSGFLSDKEDKTLIANLKERFNQQSYQSSQQQQILLDIPTTQFEFKEDLTKIAHLFSEKVNIPIEKIKNLVSERFHPDKYQEITEFASNFNVNQVAVVSNEHFLKLSKSLSSFIDYLFKYYSYSMLCPMFEPENVFDNFDILIPLSGILKMGNVQKAEEFCNLMNVSLFSVVIQNQSIFQDLVDQAFYDKFEDQYPLELKAMKMEFQNERNLHSTPHDYYNLTEEQITYQIIEKVKSNIEINYDDCGFYKIDHNRLYKLLIKSRVQDFNNAMVNLLKMIDYVAPPEDYQFIEEIYLNNIMSEKNIQNDKEMIEFYLKDKLFDEAISYARPKIISEHNHIEIMETLLSVNDVSFVERLFLNFPNMFEFLANKLCNNENQQYLHLIEKYSPIVKRKYIKAFINLPNEIRSKSYIFDEQSIANAFISNYDFVFEITNSHSNIVSDAVKMSIIQSASDSFRAMNKLIMHLYPLFNWYDDVNKLFISKSLNCIRSTVISSIESEDEAILNIRSIESVLPVINSRNQISHLLCIDNIEALKEFLELRIYQKYHFEYNFHNFENKKEFSEYLSSIIFKFDLLEIQSTIHNAFDNDDANLTMHRALSMIQLGLPPEARMVMKSSNNKILIDSFHPFNSECPKIDLSHPFFSSLILHPIFNNSFIETVFYPPSQKPLRSLPQIPESKLEIPDDVSYNEISYLQETINKVKQSKEKTIFNPYELKFYAIHNSTISTSLNILIASDNFPTSYQILMSITDDEDRKKHFVHDFYPASFIYANRGMNPIKVLKFLRTQDSEMLLTGPLFQALADYFEKNEMYSLLSSLFYFENRFEDCAKAAIKAFSISKCSRIYFLEQAKNCLRESLLIRNHKIPMPVSKYGDILSSNETLESITELNEKVILQSEIFYHFNEKRKGMFNDSFNILYNDDEAINNCAAIMIIDYRDDIYKQLKKIFSNSLKSKIIISKISVELAKLEYEKIESFLNHCMKKHSNLLQNLFTPLMLELSLTKNWDYIIKIVINFIIHPERQIQYLIEFDMLTEAIGIIFINPTEQATQYLPYIAHRASMLGSKDLLEQISAL